MNFSDRLDLSKLDAVFIFDNSPVGRSVIEKALSYDHLRVIDISPARFEDWSSMEMEYGLSEINRKPLVRGARMAIIPSHVAAIALIALHPLASHLLLPDEISLQVHAPEHFVKNINVDMTVEEISRQLKRVQCSFNGKINVTVVPDGNGRTLRICASMACPLAIAEVEKVYDSVYDDHNFTFTTLSKVGSEEVEGTQKCVVSFSKPGAGLIEVESIGDCYLRGGAGDGTHVLNLLFALHEKVGLNLKPSRYGELLDKPSAQASWFA